jgi:hypothetical protein
MCEMNINYEAKELIGVLFEGNKTVDATLKLKLYNEIKELLQSGTDKDEITNKIKTYKMNHPKTQTVSTISIIMKEQVQVNKDEDNLIKPGEFYFHPRLQLTPGMPVIAFDMVRGVFESSYSKFYLEIVDRFTTSDLMDYALSKLEVADKSEAANIGSLKYLLGKYKVDKPYQSLDLMLYTIDAASGLMKDLDMMPMAKLIKLDDFIQEGLKLYHDAYNTKKSAGMDKIIPR